VGFQSEADLTHFTRYIQAEAHAEDLGQGRWRAFSRTLTAGAFPIGIDVEEFAGLTAAPEGREMYERMRDEYSRRKLLVGVDRLDYSKGLPQRLRAFRELLQRYPENNNSATLIQIASPSREAVHAYGDILRELESLCGSINGDFGELDWMPVRYMHRTVARKKLPGLYRAATRGAGDAAARRHEPGGQGICGGAGPGRPRRAGAVTLCRRGRAAERGAAGQPL
jgi:trehalose 6-phosphate synthase